MFYSLDPTPASQCCKKRLSLRQRQKREGARLKNLEKRLQRRRCCILSLKSCLSHGNSSSSPRPSLWKQIYLFCNSSKETKLLPEWTWASKPTKFCLVVTETCLILLYPWPFTGKKMKAELGKAVLWEKNISSANGFVRWKSHGDLFFYTRKIMQIYLIYTNSVLMLKLAIAHGTPPRCAVPTLLSLHDWEMDMTSNEAIFW